jgi:hypothetical protein
VLMNMMEVSKRWLCDDRSSLSALMRRRCCGRPGCALSDGTTWVPVVEIADILGQELLQMALIEYEHVVQARRPNRSDPTLGDRVGPRRSERRANLGNTEITDPPIEAGAIIAVAIMNKKKWRLVVPTAAFDNLLCRPLAGWIRRHVQNFTESQIGTCRSAVPKMSPIPPARSSMQAAPRQAGSELPDIS